MNLTQENIEAVLKEIESLLHCEYERGILPSTEYENRLEAVKDCKYALAYSLGCFSRQVTVWTVGNGLNSQEENVDDAVYSDMMQKIKERVY